MAKYALPDAFTDDHNVVPRFLSLPEVVRLTGLSRSSVCRLEQAGTFPQRIRLSPRRVAWLESEVRRWIAWRCAEGRR